MIAAKEKSDSAELEREAFMASIYEKFNRLNPKNQCFFIRAVDAIASNDSAALYALAEETGHQLLADYAKEFEETAAPMDTR